MYNMLFGVNPAFPILFKSLGISYHGKSLSIEGEYSPGRFRDIYLSNEGDKILLYTRNGGGNRNCWEEEGCENATKPSEHNPTCLVYVNWKLTQHPLYITDHDDDFDCTYAYFEFKVPDSLQLILDKLMEAQGGAPVDISEKFNALVTEMQTMTKEQVESDPRFKPLVGLVDKIVEATKS
jgi:hypothetical protein